MLLTRILASVNGWLFTCTHELIYRYQTFRYPQDGNDRVRAQVLVKGVTVRDRKVIDPRSFLIEHVGIDPESVESLSRPNTDQSMEEMITHFEELDMSFRSSAALDDDDKQLED
jgi:hypothetical protein